MDDVFVGAETKFQAVKLITHWLRLEVSKGTTAVMNPLKSKVPAQELEILGLRYDARSRRVSVPPSKQEKYLNKLRRPAVLRQR